MDQAIVVLGGQESVRLIDFRRLAGFHQGGTAAYIRKSTSCIRSFLLLAALRACFYDVTEIAQTMATMLSRSGLAEKHPAATSQIEKLIEVLFPKTEDFLEDISECHMRVMTMAAESTDLLESSGVCTKLIPKTLAGLLVHAFRAIAVTSSKDKNHTGDVVELRGATGFLDIATMLMWLAPGQISISMRYSSKHPTGRSYSIGDANSPLLLQTSASENKGKTEGSGWYRIPWSSARSIATNALGWASIAKPLLSGKSGLFGGVALTAANMILK